MSLISDDINIIVFITVYIFFKIYFNFQKIEMVLFVYHIAFNEAKQSEQSEQSIGAIKAIIESIINKQS